MSEAPGSFSGDGPRPLPRWLWFGAALLVFLVSSWIAFHQEPHPDAYRQADPTQLGWWRYPVELNADRRLLWVRVDLNDVYALKETGHVWVVGGGGLILHSTDYGRSWRRTLLPQTLEYPEKPEGPPILGVRPSPVPDLQAPAINLANSDLSMMHFVNAKDGWVAGYNGALFRTKNGGETWEHWPAGYERAFPDPGENEPEGIESWRNTMARFGSEFRKSSFSDEQRGWLAGTRGTLLTTEDGGKTWRRVTRPWISAPAGTYRIFPAPWYFLSLVFVGLLLVPALRSPKPEVISESVADLLVSDRPISAGDADVFDFKSVALGLSRFLRNEKTVPPLTIAVTGEWGTGKSSLMNLLQGDLKRYGFRPVWFNAWHHQKEEHLLASLLATVRAQAVPPWWRPEGMIFRLRLLRIRWERFWPLIAFLLIVFSFSLGYFRSHPGQLDAAWASVKALPSLMADPGNWLREKGSKASGPWIALLISGAGLLISLWRGIKGFGVNPASLLARDSARTRVSDLEKLTGFRHQFASEFRDITEALNPRTMVVMIDDLDRCKPEMVLEVLESVNFLISSGDCFVVLGMARERVIRCVGLSFKDVASELLVTPMSVEEKEEKVDTDELARRRRIEFATQYLEKLINIEVPVPAPTYAQSQRLLQESAPRDETPEGRRDRRRRASWKGIRQALPVAGVVVLLFAGYWIGASRTSQKKPDGPAPAEVVSSSAPPTQASAPSGTETATPPESTAPLKPAEMEAAQESSLPVFLAYILLSVLLGLGVWRLTVPPGVVIRDSREFEAALETWHPLVFTFRKTPRSIKRFLNRVRYLAMLQRKQTLEPSWLQRIFRRGKQKEETGETFAAIPEHALVALVAIEHSRPDWFQNESFFRDPRMVPGGNSIPAKIQEAIRDTPLKSYRDAYLRISQGIQVR